MIEGPSDHQPQTGDPESPGVPHAAYSNNKNLAIMPEERQIEGGNERKKNDKN
jgi:hypothetical protein